LKLRITGFLWNVEYLNEKVDYQVSRSRNVQPGNLYKFLCARHEVDSAHYVIIVDIIAALSVVNILILAAFVVDRPKEFGCTVQTCGMGGHRATGRLLVSALAS
jgi:hypothetical protein